MQSTLYFYLAFNLVHGDTTINFQGISSLNNSKAIGWISFKLGMCIEQALEKKLVFDL